MGVLQFFRWRTSLIIFVISYRETLAHNRAHTMQYIKKVLHRPVSYDNKTKREYGLTTRA